MLFFDAIYVAGWIAAFPWLVWRRVRYGKNRRGMDQKLLGNVPRLASNDLPVVWLHAVSVGEVNLLEPLVRELGHRFPRHRLVVSTTTETGFDQAIRKFGEPNVFFFPFDFSWSVNRALERIRPTLIVLAELELWPNFLRACQAQRIPVAVANARIGDRSFKSYLRFSWLTGKMFRRLSFVGAQSAEYANRFVSLGVPPENVDVTGNMKFDGAQTDRRAPAILKLAAELQLPTNPAPSVTNSPRTSHDSPSRDTPNQVLFVAGSTQPEEHPMVVDAWLEARRSIPDMRLVVVPRHPHTATALCQMLENREIPFYRRSTGTRPSVDPAEVIVVDVIGELPAWWGLASFGYVGGSMGKRGGQSMIEPAAMGVPVCFGPKTGNFRDVVAQLLAKQAALVVHDEEELLKTIQRFCTDRKSMNEMGVRSRELVLANQGAVRNFVDQMERLELIAESSSKMNGRRVA